MLRPFEPLDNTIERSKPLCNQKYLYLAFSQAAAYKTTNLISTCDGIFRRYRLECRAFAPHYLKLMIVLVCRTLSVKLATPSQTRVRYCSVLYCTVLGFVVLHRSSFASACLVTSLPSLVVHLLPSAPRTAAGKALLETRSTCTTQVRARTLRRVAENNMRPRGYRVQYISTRQLSYMVYNTKKTINKERQADIIPAR